MTVLHQPRVRILLAVVIVLVAGLVLALQVLSGQGTIDMRRPFGEGGLQPAGDMEPAVANDIVAPTNCRYGVGYIPDLADSLNWIPTLDAGWYINFVAQPLGGQVNSAAFAPVVRIQQDKVGNVRQPTYTVNPPLTYFYTDENGKVREGLGTLVSKNPGHFWIIGNEVDVDNNDQDNTMPEVYARAYHEAYHFIKKADPTAKVAIAGLSMMTPGRLQYLDIVWNTYKSLYGKDMPVDIWNMHLYILEERNPDNPNQYGDGKIALGTDPDLAKLTSYGNPAFCPALNTPDNDPHPEVHCRAEHDSVRIFREQVYNLRTWMKAHGQQNKPLIISEFGLLYPYITNPDGSCEFLIDERGQCFTAQRVTSYLQNTISFLENTKDTNLGYPQDEYRLVQQWLWYSIVTEPEWSGGSSNLIVRNYRDFPLGDPAALTPMGKAFQQLATSRAGASNLVAGQAQGGSAFAAYGSGKATVTLRVSYGNAGSRSVAQPFDVTFYSDANLTKPIGSVRVNPAETGAITGCSWDNRYGEQAQVTWDNLSVGSHRYWAKIDSGNAIGETNENDNVVSGTVRITNRNVAYIPAVGTMMR